MHTSGRQGGTGNAKVLDRVIAAAVRGRVPVLVWGNPGLGKTARLTADLTAWGHHVETVVGSNRENTDFLGLPLDTGQGVTYNPPAWALRLAGATRPALILDEFTTIGSTMKAMLRVVQEKYVGDLSIDGTAIIAIANRPEIAVDGYDLPAPIANRFVHLDWVFDAASWLDNVADSFSHYAPTPAGAGLGPDEEAHRLTMRAKIVEFLRQRPDLIEPAPPADPVAQGGAWPSPRSWDNAMRLVAELRADDEDAQYVAVLGAVGEGAALAYFEWLSTADLYDPVAVIADPALVDWKDPRLDRLYALTRAVAALGLADGTAATWNAAMGVMVVAAKAGRPDVALGSVTRMVRFRPRGGGISAEARAAFADLFTKTTAWATTPTGA